MKPRLLDLFCGAGGAAIGYRQAGFDVVGVDTRPQPGYPGTFVQGDAIEYLFDLDPGSFDVIHASPPCQGYSKHVSSESSRYAGTKGKDEPRLIGATLIGMVRAAPVLGYVIENVTGAAREMPGAVLLCGTMFALPIARHRLFMVSPRVSWHLQPTHWRCSGVAKQYAESRGWDARDMTVTGKGRHSGTKDRWAEIMGWPGDVPVTQHGLREAIPPAYAHWVGLHMLPAGRGQAPVKEGTPR